MGELPGAVDPERIAVLEHALDAVGPGDTRARVQLLATLTAELTFDPDLARRRAVAEEAIAIARRLDDASAVIAALIGLLSLPDRPDSEHLRWADEVIDLATAVDDQVSFAIAAARQSRRRRRLPTGIVSSAIWQCPRRRRNGSGCSSSCGDPWARMPSRRSSTVISLPRNASPTRSSPPPPTSGTRSSGTAASSSPYERSKVVAPRSGRCSTALLRAPGTAAAEIGASGDSYWPTSRRATSSGARRLRGRGSAVFPGLDDQLWLTKKCIDAYACSRLGDRAAGHVAQGSFAPNAALLPASPSVLLFSAAACPDVAALLDEHDEADGRFAPAIALTAAFRAPYLLASPQLEWARAILGRDDPQPDQARTLLTNALATARSHGYGEIDRDAVDLQAKQGFERDQSAT